MPNITLPLERIAAVETMSQGTLIGWDNRYFMDKRGSGEPFFVLTVAQVLLWLRGGQGSGRPTMNYSTESTATAKGLAALPIHYSALGQR